MVVREPWICLLLVVLGCPGRRDAAPRADDIPDPKARLASAPPVEGTTADASAAAARSGAFLERQLERDTLVAQLERNGISHRAVLATMRRVPRHAFVAEAWQREAYENHPLPIGHGQTISQPEIVAAMTALARPTQTDKCLEIGTGSGYQAAILAELCAKVYSIEYLEPLARLGESNLRSLGYGPDRIALRHGDGYRGWPDAEPFDVVLVTAAPDHVPKPLLDGLARGGRLVIPVGPKGVQQLELWTRKEAGRGDDAFDRRTMMTVRFVPFLGDAAAQSRQ